MRSQYIIAITILIALTASMLFLAYSEKSQREKNEDFWSIYFIDPFSADNRFVIDNRSSEDKTFHYEIARDETTVQSGDIDINSKSRELVTTNDALNTKQIIITVSEDKKKKTIEKK